MNSLKTMEQIKELIHEKTGGKFKDGANGQYVTLYRNLQDFIDERGITKDETKAEAFERITGYEWASLNHDSTQPFIAYDNANASYSFWFLTRADDNSIRNFIEYITSK